MKKLLSDAAILATITVFVYFCAYMFEAGHAIRFGYPADIIGPTVYSFQGMWVIIVIFYILFFLQINLQYWPIGGKSLALLLFFIIILILLILTMQAISPSLTPLIVVFSVLVGWGAQVVFIRKNLKQKSNNADENYNNLQTQKNLDNIFTIFDFRSRLLPGTVAHDIITKLGYDPLAAAGLILMIIPVISFYAGIMQGLGQREFYEIASPTQSGSELVVRMVGGTIISVPYDRSTGNYVKKYHIRQISSLGSDELIPVYIDLKW